MALPADPHARAVAHEGTDDGQGLPSPTTHSMKLMWGCIAIDVIAVIASVALANASLLLFLIPARS